MSENKYSWMEEKKEKYSEEEERRFIDHMKLLFLDCLLSKEFVDGQPMPVHICNMIAKKLDQPVESITEKIFCLT